MVRVFCGSRQDGMRRCQRALRSFTELLDVVYRKINEVEEMLLEKTPDLLRFED
jgi:hypothetical protein